MVRIILQVIGILILIPVVIIVTLRIDNMNADGPSILFPGGELVSGELHSGTDPDWKFTDDIFTIELQLNDPMGSRIVFIMEHDGKVYVPSGYMKSFLGRIWKGWAFAADAGDGLGVARIEGVRYERRLIRIKEGPKVKGVAAKLAQKYAGGALGAAEEIENSIKLSGTWIFELASRNT